MIGREDLEAAIERVVDAERCCWHVTHDGSRAAALIVAKREVGDARADLADLLDVLDFELAFAPALAVKP